MFAWVGTLYYVISTYESGEVAELAIDTGNGAHTARRIPKATRVDALPEDEANLILEVMRTKYGDRMTAADVNYLMLGRSRDRVAVVANLIEE